MEKHAVVSADEALVTYSTVRWCVRAASARQNRPVDLLDAGAPARSQEPDVLSRTGFRTSRWRKTTRSGNSSARSAALSIVVPRPVKNSSSGELEFERHRRASSRALARPRPGIAAFFSPVDAHTAVAGNRSGAPSTDATTSSKPRYAPTSG
jgi:hypothetical protein